MEYLERLDRGGQDLEQAAWYAIRDDSDAALERYVLSTPQTRAICNQPELMGVAYTEALCQGMVAGLQCAPFRHMLEQHPEEAICVLHLLRGGLNFELRRALHQALGLNRHGAAFMSSQRFQRDGTWSVTEDSYRKLDIPDRAVLLVGDVVATGVTLENGLEAVLQHIVDQGRSVRALIFVTIGGPRAQAVLGKLDGRLREAFGEAYERSCLIYLEGRFELAHQDTPLAIKEPGTDLLRRGALLAPELVLSQYDALSYALERCSIYDAGSRAFDVPTYARDVLEYWQQLRGLAEQGWSLRDAILERWPEAAPSDRAAFLTAASRRWQGLDAALLHQVLAARQAFWAELVGPFGNRPSTLQALCEQRIQALATAAALAPETP